jgi:hypothetical protein
MLFWICFWKSGFVARLFLLEGIYSFIKELFKIIVYNSFIEEIIDGL